MNARTFVRASDKQIEAAGGDAAKAQQRMLDWNIDILHGSGTRVALGDFAVVPGQQWRDPISAYSRGLEGNALLNGGEIGATAVKRSITSSESVSLRGIELVRQLSNELLLACMMADPRGLPPRSKDARALLAQDRQYAPTGYLAVADLAVDNQGTAIIDITQMGDVFVALDTAGRVPRVLQGSLQERAYAGEQILGADKAIDLLKGELKAWISAKYAAQGVSDQFFYDLIFNGTYRPQFTPHGLGNVEAFKVRATDELRSYACAKYASKGLTPEIFNAMIAQGMTPWQQNVAQNNPAAGPFWYPALDPIGDTPEEGVSYVRLAIDNVLTGPTPRLVLWTDGSAPTTQTGISIDNLKGLNAYGEQTRMEIEVR